ncbi:hypothetical protein HYDPIDRAFT_106543 [Hydnomerulius pinastri MD-312]|nr:hypothetical protein HYDPIDRAFT_106543 [Hydnomerulius pinastri MD-312]
MNSNYNLHLTYLTVRARGEPVLLFLVDSGLPFTLEEISPTTWGQLRKTVTNDDYPYSALPVLRVREKSAKDGSKDFVLAETSAILAFLEEFLAPKGTPLLKDTSLEVRASTTMIKEASLFFLDRVWGMSVNEDWLAPPKRDALWRGLVIRYLRNTERALSGLQKSIEVAPSKTEPLAGHSVAIATAINLITDLFPSAKDVLKEGAQYKLCGRLWAAVRERPRIVEYWQRKQGAKPWTITLYGTAEWIAKEATQFDRASGRSSKL